MGQNRRYADHYGKLMDRRLDDFVMRGQQPMTLTDDELELDHQPVTRPPRAVPVVAWVRFGATPLRVDAEAVAWTPRAVAIRWRTSEGVQRAWVWAGAVTRT